MNDTAAVILFADRMTERLDAARMAGRYGWDDSDVISDDELKALLIKNVESEDWVDVANYAMMLYWRNQNEQ